jgi:O-antigen/teichoic acid export membrane protein
MSLIKKLAGETMIYGVSSILSRLLNYVVMAFYLTRVFETGEYGVVSDMYTYAALLMVIFTYRMETTFFRFASEKDKLPSVFSTTSISLLISTAFFVGVLLFFAQPLADFLKYSDHVDYVQWFVFILAFDALAAIPFARLRLENRPIRFAVIKTLNILVNIFFIFFFLEICPALIARGWDSLNAIYDPENRIAYVFIANFLGSLAVILFLLPQYRKLRFTFDPVLWKKMIRYAMPLVVVGLAAVINQLINVPLLKYYLPYDDTINMQQVGIYTACFKLAILMSLFIQAFNYAAEPFFFRNAQRGDSRKVYAQVGQAFAIVGSLVFLGITLYLDVVKFFIGPSFREALYVVPIVTLAFLFLGLYYNFSIWYKLSDKTIIGAYISVVGAVMTIALNIFLIPVYGYEGSAWASLACYVFMALASYLVGRKYYPIPYPMAKIFTYIGFAVGAYFLSSMLRGILNDRFIYIILVNTAILLTYVFIIYRMEKVAIQTTFFPAKSREDILDD